MGKEYVVIQLKDTEYYDDDFQYEPFIVEKDEDFEEKFKKLMVVCHNYESFDEVEDFITENFTKLDFEKRVIGV
ncbi:MAG: hypothetical protein MSA56_06155 [Clostridium sp.]|nr:hypothetical protein [Clostridium sp.]